MDDVIAMKRLAEAESLLRRTEKPDYDGLLHYGDCLGKKLAAMGDKPGDMCDPYCIAVRTFLTESRCPTCGSWDPEWDGDGDKHDQKTFDQCPDRWHGGRPDDASLGEDRAVHG